MTFENKAFDHIYALRYDVCDAITEKTDSTREEHALVRLFYNKVFEHTRQRSELSAQAVEQCWKENHVELKGSSLSFLISTPARCLRSR
jgi:hypothetical protein